MRTVNEVSKLTGVSIRTLQYYDKMGLLPASERTASGYRLYDDAALERLQQILLFRALEFPLKEICRILSRPDFDREKALRQQIELLTLKREHLDNLITFARGIQTMGANTMDFSAFDTTKQDEYVRQAQQQWGDTPAWQEFAAQSKGRSKEREAALGQGLMLIFGEFGRIRSNSPADAPAQALVRKLQSYINEHYYTCTPEILRSLGQMYTSGEFARNIDAAGGEGTAQFVADAIDAWHE